MNSNAGSVVPNRKKVMGVLIVGVLMGALDISIVGPALPSIERALWMDASRLSWVFSVYVLASLAGIPLMARLSDVFGRRSVYTWSVALFGLGSLMVSITDHYNFLLIGRAIQGFGVSGILPVASAVIGDVYPPEKRGRMLGLIGAVFGIAFIIGPILAGSVLHFFSWNALFFINVPVSIILIYLSRKVLPQNTFFSSTDIDVRGIIALTATLVFLTLAINRIQPDRVMDSLTNTITLTWIASFIISLLFLIATEKHEPYPVVNLNFFFNRQIRLIGLMALGLGLFQASFVFVPKLVIELFGVDDSTAGFMLLPVILGSAVTAPLAGRLTDARGSRLVIFIGLLMATSGLFVTGTLPESKALFYLAGSLIGVGFSMRTSLNYVMLNEATAADRASAQGLLTIFISIGQLTGASLIGSIVASPEDSSQGFAMAFTLLAFISAVLTILSLWLKGHKEEGQRARD